MCVNNEYEPMWRKYYWNIGQLDSSIDYYYYSMILLLLILLWMTEE